MNAVIGSGFWSDMASAESKRRFSELWFKTNTVPGDKVVIVDNSECGIWPCQASILRINHNLGHVGSHIGAALPKLLGWSMSWILPALVAYSERMDFLYIEQDCLCFGDWRNQIDAAASDVEFVFGRNSFMDCEQSLFWIKCDEIPSFVGRYISIAGGDGQVLPETKFIKCLPARWRTLPFPGGRDRPIATGSGTFYVQQITGPELEMLAASGFV